MNIYKGLFFLIAWNFCMAASAKVATEDQKRFDEKMEQAQGFYLNQEYETALNLQFDILRQLEAAEQSNQIIKMTGQCSAALARMYFQKNDSLSFDYANKAISYARKVNDNATLFQIYSLKYRHYLIKNAIDQLPSLSDSCLFYAQRTGGDAHLFEAYSNLAILEIKLNKPEQGVRENVERAVQLLANIPDNQYSAGANNLGNIYIFLGDEYAGRELYYKSYSKALEMEDLENETNAAYNLFASYIETEEYDTAYYYSERYTEALEGMYVGLLESQFSDANAKYETEKKDKEIALKNKLLVEQKLENSEKSREKQIYLFALALFGLVMISLYFLYRIKSSAEKKRVRQELEKAREFTQLRTKFLANIAHEIRTPLTLTKGYIALCQEHDGGNLILQNYLKDASKSADKILENADDILSVIKNETSNFPKRSTEVYLNGFLKETLSSFQSIAEPKGIDLQFDSNLASDFLVLTDKERIEKIVYNFLSNALKFSPAQSQVILSAHLNDALIISVRDFGLGIDETDKQKVFDRFFQAESGSRLGGMGIGLSLAKEFAEVLGGELTVESELGKGCLFSLVFLKENLTIIDVDKKEQEIFVSESKMNRQRYKSRVLVVEDNIEMNRYITHLLEGDYEVNSCYSGKEAFEIIQAETYDLILSDIMMPEWSGIELKEKLNTFPELKSIPFIFLSAKSRQFDVLDGLKLGVDDYITKPFDHKELFARIKNLIKNKEERERNLKDDLNFASEYGEKPDDKLIFKINNIIAENISNEDFRVEELAQEIGYSQRQLARIMKKVVGMTMVKYVLEVRLSKAYNLLRKGQFNSLSEVRYNVGIPSASYFTKKFVERFGVKPSDVEKEV